MIRKALTLMTFGGAVALVACSSDDVGERFPSTDSFCSAKADAECNAVAEACAVPKDTCKTARVGACNNLAGTASGQGRSYKASAAEACINKTKELYAARAITPEKEKEQIEVCERVFSGGRKKGEACDQPFACEGSLVCDKDFCADKVQKAEGDPCGNPGDVCPTGSYCAQRGTARFCEKKNGLDRICNAEAPCLEELRCNGTCVAKFGPGETCGNNDDCSTGFCDSGAKKCAAKAFAVGTAACKEFGG